MQLFLGGIFTVTVCTLSQNDECAGDLRKRNRKYERRNQGIIIPDWPQMTRIPADLQVSFSLSIPAAFHRGPSLNSPRKHWQTRNNHKQDDILYYIFNVSYSSSFRSSFFFILHSSGAAIHDKLLDKQHILLSVCSFSRKTVLCWTFHVHKGTKHLAGIIVTNLREVDQRPL